MKRSYLLLLLCAGIFFTGCPKNIPKADFSTKASKSYLIRQLKANVYQNEWVRFDCSRRLKTYTVNYTSGAVTCNEGGNNPNGLEEAATVRNSVLSNGIGIVDDIYLKYAASVAERRATFDFAADLTELGAGTAIGVVKGPERALNIIGIFLTAFRGGRKSAEVNFYREIPTTTLLNQMQASRETVRGDIVSKQKQNANIYDFDEALGDLITYLYEGSLVNAVYRINQDTAVKAYQAEERRKELEEVQTSPIISVEQAQIGKQIRIELEDLQRDCKASAPAAGEPDIKQRATDRLVLINTNILSAPDFTPVLEKVKTSPRYVGDPAYKAKIDEVIAKIKANPQQIPSCEVMALFVASGINGALLDLPNAELIEKREKLLKIIRESKQ